MLWMKGIHQGINMHSRHRCVKVTAAQLHNTTELWVVFGTTKGFRHVAAHEFSKTLGPDHERCIALPIFHTCTSCDIVSSFCCWSKKTVWDTWMNLDHITTDFCALASTPDIDAIDDWTKPLERFVILFYDHTSSQESVNQAWSYLPRRVEQSTDSFPQHKEH